MRPALAGRKIGALAVTEPDAGSDVASIGTRAVRDADHYVVNGTKTYITSGVRADFVTTAVRTGGEGKELTERITSTQDGEIRTTTIKRHDAQAALITLMKHHGLLKDDLGKG